MRNQVQAKSKLWVGKRDAGTFRTGVIAVGVSPKLLSMGKRLTLLGYAGQIVFFLEVKLSHKSLDRISRLCWPQEPVNAGLRDFSVLLRAAGTASDASGYHTVAEDRQSAPDDHEPPLV